MRPAAGIVGAVANPLQGAWKSAQNTIVKEQDQPHYRTRVEEGLLAVKSSTENERAKVVKRFKEAMQKEKVAERKKKITQVAEEVMYGDKILDESEGKADEKGNGGSASNSSKPTKEVADTQRSDDASYEQDVELAKRLSLYEQ